MGFCPLKANIDGTFAHKHMINPTPPPAALPSSSQGSAKFANNDEERFVEEDLFLLGDYCICRHRLLGRGSFGEVKLGFHRTTDQRVAVKIVNKAKLSPEKRQEVEREIEILKRLCGHRSIVTLHDVAEDQRHIYMFFEYVPADLLHFLKLRGRLEEHVAFRIYAQLVDAVSYLHANGIVHRDIKIEVLLDSLSSALLSVRARALSSACSPLSQQRRTYSSIPARLRSVWPTLGLRRTTHLTPVLRSGAAAHTLWRLRSSSEFPTWAPRLTCGRWARSCTLCFVPTFHSKHLSQRMC